MTIDDEVIPLIIASMLAILLLMAAVMFALADNYPNNTALYLSVLGGLSTVVAIISFMVIVADACKDGSTDAPSIGFFVWYILTALSMCFAISSAMVLTTAEEMKDNPYLIWNWGEQN